uniref:Uncharacterized protein n=1 Tax=Rhabditophanes sp. KR3021 TaxID=114890 RepID=A0AC35TM62_9BILA
MLLTCFRLANRYGGKIYSKTGRGTSPGFQCKDSPRMALSMERVYAKEHIKKFGYDSGLENTMLIVESTKNPKNRKLDSKKCNQLSQIIEEKLRNIYFEEEAIVNSNIQFTRVQVTNNMDQIKVFWENKGMLNDTEVQKLLNSRAHSMWEKLCESLYNASLPKIIFYYDNVNMFVEQMDELFEKADYGVQYRSLSNTGAILGSMRDNGIKTNAENGKKPRFLLKLKKYQD